MTDKEKKYFDEFERIVNSQMKFHKARFRKDLMQEAWVKFPEIVEKYEVGKGDFKGWSIRILFHHFVKYMRNQKYVLTMNDPHPKGEDDGDYLDFFIDYDTNLSNALNAKIELKWFFDSLEDGEEKEIIEDFYLNGINIRKLIKKYNLTNKNYHKKLKRKDVNLYKMLGDIFQQIPLDCPNRERRLNQRYFTKYHDVVELSNDKKTALEIEALVDDVNESIVYNVRSKLIKSKKNYE